MQIIFKYQINNDIAVLGGTFILKINNYLFDIKM